jgi:hypothetical protein
MLALLKMIPWTGQSKKSLARIPAYGDSIEFIKTVNELNQLKVRTRLKVAHGAHHVKIMFSPSTSIYMTTSNYDGMELGEEINRRQPCSRHPVNACICQSFDVMLP